METTAFFTAVQKGNTGAVRKLVSAGKVDVNAKRRSDSNRTALIIASGYGHLEIVKLLLAAKADACAIDDLGFTALHSASFAGQRHAIEALIAGRAIVDACAPGEVTPLHLAAIGGNLRAVSSLLAAGANIHLRDAKNNAALHLACKGGHAEVVTSLLAAGAVCSMEDPLGREALKWAIAEGHTEIARLLIGSVRSGRDDQVADGGASGVAFGALTIRDSADVQRGQGPQSSEAAITKFKSVKECMNCGKKGENIKLCTACKKVFLCSADCAKAAWPTHKKMCKKWQKERQQKEEKDQQAERDKGQQIPSAVEDGGGKCSAGDLQEKKAEEA